MNGVVHVGAHRGEEVPQYIAEGRSPIVCFEPQALGATAVRIALGDFDGEMKLRIPRHLHGEGMDTMSASGLPLIPKNAIANGWTPTECESVTVPVERFDTWARREGFQRNCSLLVIDVQGMELQVLRGFGDYLNDFDEMKIECSEPPLYDGSASASDVVDYLSNHGFLAQTQILQHGDIYFKKETPNGVTHT